MAHPKILALRELLHDRYGTVCAFPSLGNPAVPPAHPWADGRDAANAANAVGGVVSGREPLFRTGITALDAALGGGLPGGGLVELTCAAPGGSVLLLELLARSVWAGWAALVDGCDALDPGGLPAGVLRRLLWVRCGGLLQAVQATELLARDGNLPLVVVDLRGCTPASLRSLSPVLWHRIRLGLEPAAAAGVVFTPVPAVPSARTRIRLVPPRFSVQALEQPRSALVAGFQLEFLRGHRALAATA